MFDFQQRQTEVTSPNGVLNPMSALVDFFDGEVSNDRARKERLRSTMGSGIEGRFAPRTLSYRFLDPGLRLFTLKCEYLRPGLT
jgi:hypothetical protein